MLRIKVRKDLSALKKLERAKDPLVTAAELGLQAWGMTVHGEIISNLTGGKLRVRTGRLRAGQRVPWIEKRGSVVRVVFGNKIEYASIHEYGGKTPPHIILPKIKKALAFGKATGVKKGRLVGRKSGSYTSVSFLRETIVKMVHHPGSKIKEQRFIRDPVDENLPRLESFVSRYIKKEFDGK